MSSVQASAAAAAGAADLEHVIAAKGYDIPGYEEVREIFLDGPKSDDYSVKPGHVDADGVLAMMSSHGFSEDRVRTVLGKMTAARKAESDRRKQRSLDSWFRSDPWIPQDSVSRSILTELF